MSLKVHQGQYSEAIIIASLIGMTIFEHNNPIQIKILYYTVKTMLISIPLKTIQLQINTLSLRSICVKQ